MPSSSWSSFVVRTALAATIVFLALEFGRVPPATHPALFQETLRR